VQQHARRRAQPRRERVERELKLATQLGGHRADGGDDGRRTACPKAPEMWRWGRRDTLVLQEGRMASLQADALATGGAEACFLAVAAVRRRTGPYSTWGTATARRTNPIAVHPRAQHIDRLQPKEKLRLATVTATTLVATVVAAAISTVAGTTTGVAALARIVRKREPDGE
jgi:hypothetical protein